MILTERRTPTPANITFAGENAYQIYESADNTSSCSETYQANTFSKSIGEGTKNIHCRVEPSRQLFVVASRSIEVLNLFLKHCENGARRVAGLELDGEWVRKKVLLCLTFVGFQGIVEN